MVSVLISNACGNESVVNLLLVSRYIGFNTRFNFGKVNVAKPDLAIKSAALSSVPTIFSNDDLFQYKIYNGH